MASTIKNQLKESWEKLNPNIQERFAKEPNPEEKIIYKGIMQIIRCSKAGCLFAHFTRIIGNPLTPYNGKDISMDVELFKKTNEKGVYWQRTYHYPNKRPYIVTSVKKESDDGEMMECVGGGFGMYLKVYEQNSNLHFMSYSYFWRIFGIHISLPDIITPGKTHVIHTDLGNGDFRFTISMKHKFLGETFYQDGIFRKKEE